MHLRQSTRLRLLRTLKERILRWIGAIDEAAIPTYCNEDEPQGAQKSPFRAGSSCFGLVYLDNFFRQLERKSVNKITRKRQNHAFAFFTLQRGAAQGKVNLRGVYKRCALTLPRKEENPAASRTAPRGVVFKSRRSAGSSLPRNA